MERWQGAVMNVIRSEYNRPEINKWENNGIWNDFFWRIDHLNGKNDIIWEERDKFQRSLPGILANCNAPLVPPPVPLGPPLRTLEYFHCQRVSITSFHVLLNFYAFIPACMRVVSWSFFPPPLLRNRFLLRKIYGILYTSIVINWSYTFIYN